MCVCVRARARVCVCDQNRVISDPFPAVWACKASVKI